MDQRKPDLWMPLSRLWKTGDDDTLRQLLVAARLKPGVSLCPRRDREWLGSLPAVYSRPEAE
jgi:hypothetical protein